MTISPLVRSISVSTNFVPFPAMAMMGWMLLLRASLSAKEPTAELAPYTTRGIEVEAGFQGGGSLRLRYRATAAVRPARGIVAASVKRVNDGDLARLEAGKRRNLRKLLTQECGK